MHGYRHQHRSRSYLQGVASGVTDHKSSTDLSSMPEVSLIWLPGVYRVRAQRQRLNALTRLDGAYEPLCDHCGGQL